MNGNFFSDYEWHPWAKLWRIPVLGELVMAAVTETAYARSMAQSGPGISPEQARAAAKMVTPAAKRMALRHYRALDSANFRGWEDRLRELTAHVPTHRLLGRPRPVYCAGLRRALWRAGGIPLRRLWPLAAARSARGTRRAPGAFFAPGARDGCPALGR